MKGVIIVFMVAMGVALAAINGPNCGNRPLHTNILVDDGKVVGGNASKIGDHGWQVSLLRNGNFICGGSIIDENTVLCAAHCTTINTPSIYQVVRTSTRSPREDWAQVRSIRTVVSHPSYSSSTYKNDISLLFTTDPWTFDNTHVIPICLETQKTPEGTRAIATGWGSTQSGGSVVNGLREAYMPITTDANVVSQYGSSYDPVTMIGAANIGDGLDTCQGDSGGPLSTAHDNGNSLNKLKQVGIVSWGYGCGNIGIYSRVSTYISWIEQQIATHAGK